VSRDVGSQGCGITIYGGLGLSYVKEICEGWRCRRGKYDDIELSREIEYRIVGVVVEKKKRYK